jgi:hypothetical protein
MRFVSIFRPTAIHPPTGQEMEAMAVFMREAVAAGILLATEGFGPSTKNDMRVRSEGGEFLVTDGPFSETKEVIGGFALMQTRTKEEMLDWTKRFLRVAGSGECEIHQISDKSPMEMFCEG